jgi:hypothetical protein
MTLSLDPSPLASLRVPRPVDRYDHIRRRCRDLRVLDLGAYDETEIDHPQHGSWRWLHAEIAAVAKDVLGVDASPKLREAGGIDTWCGSRIVYGTVEHLDPILDHYWPDVIVAGELIEHTPDTLGWLSRLARRAAGTPVIITTPNATCIINLVLAFLKRENAHPDHLHVYSYRTLATLANRVPILDATITPYYYDPHLFFTKVPRSAAPAVTAADRLILKPMQFLFPLTGFGLILEGRLGPVQRSSATW